jgi:hypothetical protein
MKLFIMSVCLALSLTACHGYVIHPGAANQFESTTYDAISGAKTLIDVSRDQFASGVLPATLKPAMNAIVTSYNIAAPALQEYDKAIHAGLPADQQLAKLNAAVAALNKAIAAFKGVRP